MAKEFTFRGVDGCISIWFILLISSLYRFAGYQTAMVISIRFISPNNFFSISDRVLHSAIFLLFQDCTPWLPSTMVGDTQLMCGIKVGGHYTTGIRMKRRDSAPSLDQVAMADRWLSYWMDPMMTTNFDQHQKAMSD